MNRLSSLSDETLDALSQVSDQLHKLREHELATLIPIATEELAASRERRRASTPTLLRHRIRTLLDIEDLMDTLDVLTDRKPGRDQVGDLIYQEPLENLLRFRARFQFLSNWSPANEILEQKSILDELKAAMARIESEFGHTTKTSKKRPDGPGWLQRWRNSGRGDSERQ